MKLVSFLGTTSYSETVYEWNEKQVRTAYSAAACSAFLTPEEITVFATEDAYQKNWEGLCEAIRQTGGPEPLYKQIPLGKNEQELWEIFNTLTQEITSGSEISLDLTNGQRSLPAVVILASIFMKTGLNLKISHLFYGAFKVDPETPDVSPMFDLSSMLKLIDWGIAAERFNRAGDAIDLANQFLDFGREYAKTHEGEERNTGNMLRQLSEDLSEISRCYLLLRPKYIQRAEQRLGINLKKAKTSLNNIAEQKPLQLLLNRLELTFIQPKGSEKNDVKEMLVRERRMIEWYRERGHLIQAVALAREWMISWFMILYGETSEDLINDEDLRQYYENRLYDIKKWPKNGPYKHAEEKESISKLFDTLRDLRNDMVHAGKRPNPSKTKALTETVNKQIDELLKLPIHREAA